MANKTKVYFLEELMKRYGKLRKFDASLSLFELGKGGVRIYIRYSKVHPGGRTFYGLRKEDLQQLEGYPSVICFLWEGQSEPLFVPFSDYEDVFQSILPAADGQYKAQIYLQDDGIELYIANAGRFNVEAYMGWQELVSLIDMSKLKEVPELSHSQIQTLLGSIGAIKGYDIWIPANDRNKMDWSITHQFNCQDILPQSFHTVMDIISEVDVIWIERGVGKLRSLFEVEHSTPIYSGLLRFNDIHLITPNLGASYSIVSNDERRALFVRQLNRPTFKMSRLGEICTFLEYANVFSWHRRLTNF
ncbi:MAG: hypothetical protein SV062_14770 [Thermodesulfobacteriota bacterium]|nr:hypothetical protein [Thermodesulfobacteriota bacterium]